MSLNSPSTTAVPFQSGAGLETGKEGKEKKEMEGSHKIRNIFQQSCSAFLFSNTLLSKNFLTFII